MGRKLGFQFVIVALVAFLLTFGLLVNIFNSTMIFGAKKDLERETQMISDLYEKSGDISVLEVYTDGPIRAALLDKDGIVLYETDEELQNEIGRDFGEYPEIANADIQTVSSAERISDITGLKTYYCAMKLDNGQIIRLATDINPAAMIVRQSALTMVIAFVILLFVAMLSAYLISKSTMKWFASKLELLEKDPYAQLPKELESVAETVKEQHIKRKENEKARREFTANVSHELKTPLTSISGYAEMIENGMAREEDVKQFAKNIHEEAGRMITLIGDIIKLTELDETGKDAGGESFELLDLSDLVKEVTASLEINAKQKNVTVRFDGELCIMSGDRSQLYELAYNLCDNAIRYNKEGGFVTVSVRRSDGKAILKVVDTGIGIPEEYRERIFERFFRVDKSHSRKSGGTGLGLAIVKHIALCHDAEITVKDGIECGTEIKVVFPVNTERFKTEAKEEN